MIEFPPKNDDDDDDYACQAGVHHTDKCLLGTHGPSVEGRKPEAKAGQKQPAPQISSWRNCKRGLIIILSPAFLPVKLLHCEKKSGWSNAAKKKNSVFENMVSLENV